MQRVEVGDAIKAQHDGFTIDHKNASAGSSMRNNGPGITSRSVIAAAGDQPHPIAVTFKPQAIAVILDFVKPLWTGGTLVPSSGY